MGLRARPGERPGRVSSVAVGTSVGTRLLELFLPPACAGCGGVVRRHGSGLPRICVGCRSRLKVPPHPRCGRCDAPRGTGLPEDRTCPECHEWPEAVELARSAVLLAPPADRLVHGLKYGGWPQLGRPMARRMLGLLERDPAFGDARAGRLPVVPVPTTPGRLRRRGYNQARVLAAEIAEAAGLPLAEPLERREGDASQIGLLPEERRANVHDAFSIRAGAANEVRGRTVILVDDVLTTGATASAAASALERDGVRGVRLLTFARSLPHRD